jgi:RAB protein geranylgeranyltransferase component A
MKAFILYLIVAYSSGETGGAAIAIDKQDFYGSKKQCLVAAEVLENTIKTKFNRVITSCVDRDIDLPK